MGFILGFIGGALLMIGLVGDLTKNDVLFAGDAKALIEACERELPRTQTCKLVAVPKENTSDVN